MEYTFFDHRFLRRGGVRRVGIQTEVFTEYYASV